MRVFSFVVAAATCAVLCNDLVSAHAQGFEQIPPTYHGSNFGLTPTSGNGVSYGQSNTRPDISVACDWFGQNSTSYWYYNQTMYSGGEISGGYTESGNARFQWSGGTSQYTGYAFFATAHANGSGQTNSNGRGESSGRCGVSGSGMSQIVAGGTTVGSANDQFDHQVNGSGTGTSVTYQATPGVLTYGDILELPFFAEVSAKAGANGPTPSPGAHSVAKSWVYATVAAY